MDKSSEKEENEDSASGKFQYLPFLALENIYQFLSIEDMCRAGRVCKNWHTAARNSNSWKQVVLKDMTPKQIIKLLPYLPSFVYHLQIVCKRYYYKVRANNKVTTLLFPEVMSILSSSCPLLRSFIIENVYLTNRVACRRLRPWKHEEIEDNLRILTYHELERCCEFNYCLRTDIRMPPLQCLSFRNTSTLDNWSFPSHKMDQSIFDSLIIFECRFENLQFYLDHNDKYSIHTRSFRNLQELHIAAWNYPITLLLKILKNSKMLRVLSMVGCEEVYAVIRVLGESLEELCLAGSNIQDFYFDYDENSRLPNLSYLCLRGTYWMSIHILQRILNLYPLLKKVDISYTGLTKEDIKNNIDEASRNKILLKGTQSFHYSRYYCDHFKQNGHYNS